MRVGNTTWSVEADEWSVTEHPECLTLELSRDGALQVSSAQKRAGQVTEGDLYFSIGEREAWGESRITTLGEFAGVVYEYQEADTTWVRWFLRNGSVLLLVTYNGTHAAAKRERAAVIRVLSSLRAMPQNGA